MAYYAEQIKYCICACTSDPCNAFHVLNDTWRTPWTSASAPYKCDNYLIVGWYKFMLSGSDASMVTTPLITFRCGTQSSMWWNGK